LFVFDRQKEPQATLWQRFGVGFIGLFPVDSQL
jgi:hypothetical protein